jgi:hypothetical protein
LTENSADSFEEALEDLERQQQTGPALKPFLYLIVLGLTLWLSMGWWPDVSYFFEPNKPMDLGDVTELSTKEGQLQPGEYHNRYVRLSGIPVRRAQSERYRFFKLVGADIYVQTGQQKADVDDPAAGPPNMPTGASNRVRFSGSGRMLAFSRAEGSIAGVREYYETNYHTDLCGPDSNMSECTHGFVLKQGVTPSSHWYYLLITAGLIVFAAFNLYWLWLSLRERLTT